MSVYLTAAEAAAVLRFETADGFLRYARRHGIPLFRRGRAVLVLRADVVASLEAA